jgi:predicted transcriptional regulator
MTKLTARKSTSTKLTDTQLIVLSRAARREDGAVTLPEGMTENAARKLAATLIQKVLVREIRAKPGMPVWRRSEEGRSHALIITKLGRTAIKAEDEGESEDSDPGVQASASTDEVASAQSERSTPRQGSKLSIVIDLLARKRGAGIEELASAVGWLPHTTRAALTGLRKRGYAIERERSEKGGSVYRIVTGTASVLAA